MVRSEKSFPDPVILWFRRDLRLADNPALTAAAESGRPVIALYIEDTAPTQRKPGGASRWWLHHSLASLAADLKKRYGASLILQRGDAAKILPALAEETGAGLVLWNRLYDAASTERDKGIKTSLKAKGIAAESHNAALLFEPWTVQTQQGGWYKVFTAFWRACRASPEPRAPLPRPKRLQAAALAPASDRLEDWQLLPSKPDWAGGLRENWQPGEAGAARRLIGFLEQKLAGYAKGRDQPSLDATSLLSPHLHFGEVSPHQIWRAVHHHVEQHGAALGAPADKFLSEIGWREFSHHLLFHFPGLAKKNFRPEFDAFPWAPDAQLLKAWQLGRTGYPIVDAGMRELWHTGYMHNRVRMIAASFLVKHLRQPWQDGEAWFWDTLVDADPANNAASWQWVAGSGADAAPYFRIFNPILQGERFDPDGSYVRRWLPQLSRLPGRLLHQPWKATPLECREAGLIFGRDYPEPIVDHDAARRAALAAFGEMRGPESGT